MSEKLLFEIKKPVEQSVPFVFNSPHSGREYSKEFRQQAKLNEKELRQSEDALVDMIFEEIPRMGAPMLIAHFPRAWLDVNREPYELDPKMFDGKLPEYANTQSACVKAGLGTIARVVSENQPIYKEKLTVEEGLNRIEGVYHPYHNALQDLITDTMVKFGYVVLVDCHSMPSTRGDRRQPDVVLGDRYKTSCNEIVTQKLQNALENEGYYVECNTPYAGGFITKHYGRPENGLHTIQVEINRALYMNEKTMEPLPQFNELKNNFTRVFTQIFSQLVCEPYNELAPLAVAAQ